MKHMMNRFLVLSFLSFVFLLPLGASVDAGISLSTFSHIGGDASLGQGTYVKVGGLLTLTKTIEAEISSTVRLLPEIGLPDDDTDRCELCASGHRIQDGS